MYWLLIHLYLHRFLNKNTSILTIKVWKELFSKTIIILQGGTRPFLVYPLMSAFDEYTRGGEQIWYGDDAVRLGQTGVGRRSGDVWRWRFGGGDEGRERLFFSSMTHDARLPWFAYTGCTAHAGFAAEPPAGAGWTTDGERASERARASLATACGPRTPTNDDGATDRASLFTAVVLVRCPWCEQCRLVVSSSFGSVSPDNRFRCAYFRENIIVLSLLYR